jgi:hypothetical protein
LKVEEQVTFLSTELLFISRTLFLIFSHRWQHITIGATLATSSVTITSLYVCSLCTTETTSPDGSRCENKDR